MRKKLTLHAVLAGASVLLLAALADVLPSARIIGGVPGTALSTIVLLNTTVASAALVGCAIAQSGVAGQVQTVPLKNEIVEGAKEEKGNNEVDLLFAPEGGSATFATFEITGSTCLVKGTEGGVSGAFLGLALPQKTEVLRQNLVFEANTKEYKNAAGTFHTAGLVFAGKPASLEGLVLVVLDSDQVFGPF